MPEDTQIDEIGATDDVALNLDEAEAEEGIEPVDPVDSDEEEGEDEPVENIEAGKTKVTVTKFAYSSTIMLRVNGRCFDLTVGETVEVPDYLIPSLDAVDGLEYTQE